MKASPENFRKRINIVTLGCAKNVVDSEKISALFPAEKFIVEHNSKKKSDITIINTCAFINDAKQESIDTILHYAQNKTTNQKLYIIGCLAQRYKHELLEEIKEIDGCFGLHEIQKLLKAIASSHFNRTNNRILATPGHYAYLKISEGCDRKCSFCAIPFIRGKHKSVPLEELVDEAQMLADKGVKELILVAQDTTYYGLDIYKKRTLALLLEKLSDIKQFSWIRLHYTYPAGFPTDVLEVMQNRKNICKYLDIPLQHINDGILKSMRRGISKKETIELIQQIRLRVPDVALRTTFIVGYPGEGRKEFDELYRFVEEQKFERMGVFVFSPEEGTQAAELKPYTSNRTTQKRFEKLMELQQNIALQHNQKFLGKVLKVLIDKEVGKYLIGRTEFDSPDIDNEVIVIPGYTNVSVGRFYNVMITKADVYDLYGVVV